MISITATTIIIYFDQVSYPCLLQVGLLQRARKESAYTSWSTLASGDQAHNQDFTLGGTEAAREYFISQKVDLFSGCPQRGPYFRHI